MKKYIILAFALILFAREDPFELKIAPKTSPQSVEGEVSSPLEQLEATLPTTARILKEVRFVYQKLDGSIETQVIKVDKDIDWHYPISISQVQDKSVQEEKKPLTYKMGDFNFVVSNKKIYIQSPYKLKQNFLLPKPFRIILDVSRDQKIINQELKLENRFFTSVFIGTHQDFYRITLTLDGQYGYNIQQDEKGYYIILK